MRTPPDLHPDDIATREGLRDMLVDARRHYGMTQRDLASRLGRTPPTIGWMEVHFHWRVSTVQRWAHAVGLRLLLIPAIIDSCSRQINDDLFLLRPADPDAAMAFDRRAFIESLADARRTMRVTQRILGERMGITENGVAEIEKERDVLLVNAQRYCRALGTSLVIDLEECPSWQAG